MVARGLFRGAGLVNNTSSRGFGLARTQRLAGMRKVWAGIVSFF